MRWQQQNGTTFAAFQPLDDAFLRCADILNETRGKYFFAIQDQHRIYQTLGFCNQDTIIYRGVYIYPSLRSILAAKRLIDRTWARRTIDYWQSRCGAASRADAQPACLPEWISPANNAKLYVNMSAKVWRTMCRPPFAVLTMKASNSRAPWYPRTIPQRVLAPEQDVDAFSFGSHSSWPT